MKKLLFLLLPGTFLLHSCGGGAEGDKSEGNRPKKAVGGAVYGGTFNVSENDKNQTFFPLEIIDVPSWHIATQMYEGLVKFNQKDLTIVPALAEKWEVNADQTEFTFSLRKGVKFHDDECFSGGKGREMTAKDVKFSLELLCTQGVADENFKNSIKGKIAGANEFYEKKAEEVSGIKVVDNNTIKITLTQPSSSFLYILANPITSVIPEEAYKKYGKDAKVGTGPFKFLKKGDPEKEVYLVRNDNYYRKDQHGNQLPFLDSVHFRFIDDNSAQLEEFRKGKLSMLYGLPAEKISEVVQENMPDFTGKPPKYLLDRQSEMVTQFYELNLSREQFKDVRVRRALSMAINRARINENILNGQASVTGPNNLSGNYGIVPPVKEFKGYDTSIVKGYGYNPDMAKKLMAQAGFADGSKFPTINLVINSGGSRHSKVATEVANQWRNVLGINVEINTVPLSQKLEDSQYGRGDIFRSAWVADFPSPETFLTIGFGGNVPDSPDKPSHPNTMRYINPEFDTLFLKGVRAANEEERYKYFAQAEAVLMQDCPIIVLWYGENYKLLHSNVHNFYNNAMNYFDLSDIFLRDAKPEDFDANKKAK